MSASATQPAQPVRTILVVDDQLELRKLLCDALKAEGLDVCAAQDGVEALGVLARVPVDAIVSDVLMPRMDGYQLCQEIRADPRYYALPFICYTATYTSPSDAAFSQEVGADGYLKKPAPVVAILAAIAEARRAVHPNPRPLSPPQQLDLTRQYSERLVAKLEEKNVELQQAAEQLRLANEQLRALAARTESVREQARAAIAREIHDVLAQELTRLKIDLIWLAKRAARPVDEPTRLAVRARLDDAIAQADSAIGTVQRIATELRPVILDRLGLPAAIEWQVEDFARRTGVNHRTRTPPGDTALGHECATAVFRILQESLTNIARHAGATAVDVSFAEDASAAVLIVADNGRGITPAQMADAHSIGLLGMKERAQAYGGTVEITGAPGAGTVVRVCIPFVPDNPASPS